MRGQFTLRIEESPAGAASKLIRVWAGEPPRFHCVPDLPEARLQVERLRLHQPGPLALQNPERYQTLLHSRPSPQRSSRHLTDLCASASQFPVAGGSVDLVTAFEVIEHLDDWPALIHESARVLSPEGMFLVSTPNTCYYAEARGPFVPNPFHVHEFEYEEFEQVLKQAFLFVEILAQNQQGTITFSGEWPAEKMAGFIPPSRNVADAPWRVV